MPAGGVVRGAARVTGSQLHTAAAPLMLRSRQNLATSWQSVGERASASAVGRTKSARRAARAGAVAAAAPAAVSAAMRGHGSVRARQARGETILENSGSAGSTSPERDRPSARATSTDTRARGAGAPGARGVGETGAPSARPAAPDRASSGAARQALDRSTPPQARRVTEDVGRPSAPTSDAAARLRTGDRVAGSGAQRPLTQDRPRPRQPRKRRPDRPKPTSSEDSK
jgi:hypothetical protein